MFKFILLAIVVTAAVGCGGGGDISVDNRQQATAHMSVAGDGVMTLQVGSMAIDLHGSPDEVRQALVAVAVVAATEYRITKVDMRMSPEAKIDAAMVAAISEGLMAFMPSTL